MTAGRDLDAQIAKAIFNAQFVAYDQVLSGYPFLSVHGTPPYSTDITAAWLVVQAMKVKGFTCTIIDGIVSGTSNATFYGGSGSFTANTDTTPAVICLAALKAAK